MILNLINPITHFLLLVNERLGAELEADVAALRCVEGYNETLEKSSDAITVSAPFGRVDLKTLKRARLGGKAPSDDDYRLGGGPHLAVFAMPGLSPPNRPERLRDAKRVYEKTITGRARDASQELHHERTQVRPALPTPVDTIDSCP